MNKLAEMIAPCGINCSICLWHLREKNRCGGCWAPEGQKRNHCMVCRIKNCEHISRTGSRFCYECPEYPCARLKQLEKRYRVKYHVQIFENFRDIKELGPEEFARLEGIKHRCPDCGGTICIHTGNCLNCKINDAKNINPVV